MRMISVDPAEARAISWKAYTLRFAFGGAVTALTGLIGNTFGPEVGGLFLGFPSIAIASMTMVERDKGKNAVGADAAGMSIGCLGLLAFGATVWALGRHIPAWLVLGSAFLLWFVAAGTSPSKHPFGVSTLDRMADSSCSVVCMRCRLH